MRPADQARAEDHQVPAAVARGPPADRAHEEHARDRGPQGRGPRDAGHTQGRQRHDGRRQASGLRCEFDVLFFFNFILVFGSEILII